MTNKLTFDLSCLPISLFKEITESAINKNNIKTKETASNLVKKFNVDKYNGLSFNDATALLKDLIDIEIKNKELKKDFLNSKKRALFLPHCCRKYIDSRCKAKYDSKTATYVCGHCSNDCIVNKVTKIAKKHNYSIFILPGSSCVEKIMKNFTFGGIIGVACINEMKLAAKYLKKFKIPAQGVPLIKNGCSETIFDYNKLIDILNNKNNNI